MNYQGIGGVTTVICDDDPLALHALGLLLRDQGIEVLGACETANECLQMIRHHPPQVAIIDLQLGGDRRGGIELIRRIRKASPFTLCLVLTATDANGELLPEAFFAGAHGFRRKGYLSGEELPNLVKRMAAGDWEIGPELASILIRLVTVQSECTTSREDTGSYLIPAEYAVLERLADGMRPPAIAETLNINEARVYAYIRNITAKFQSSTEPLKVRNVAASGSLLRLEASQ